MKGLEEIYSSYSDMDSDLSNWVDRIYASKFAVYFQNQRSLSYAIKNKDVPISDSDLEVILTDIPIRLFEVAEPLNKMRLSIEGIKLSMKEKERIALKTSSLSSEAKRKEEAAESIHDDKLLIEAMTSIMVRVENEMACSKELIMGAKKIWDGRRQSERTPISEVNAEDLPNYTSTKQYIK